MKKTLATAFMLILAISVFAGCGKKEETKETETKAVETELQTETYKETIAETENPMSRESFLDDPEYIFLGSPNEIVWCYDNEMDDIHGRLTLSDSSFIWTINDEEKASGTVTFIPAEENEFNTDIISLQCIASDNPDFVGKNIGDYSVENKTYFDGQYHVALAQLNNGTGLFTETIDPYAFYILLQANAPDEASFEDSAAEELKSNIMFYGFIWRAENGEYLWVDDAYMNEENGRFENTGIRAALRYKISENPEYIESTYIDGPVPAEIYVNDKCEIVGMSLAYQLQAPTEDNIDYIMYDYEPSAEYFVCGEVMNFDGRYYRRATAYISETEQPVYWVDGEMNVFRESEEDGLEPVPNPFGE